MGRSRWVPWLELSCEALTSDSEDAPWGDVARLLRDQLHAPLAGLFLWGADGHADVQGFPEPTDYDLGDVAARAPAWHPLARYYAASRDTLPRTIDEFLDR